MFQELIDNVSNVEIFTSSLASWIENISITSIIIMIMMIFMIVGGVDRIRGNKLGYGEKFEEGFNIMGPTAAALVGIVAAAPILAVVMKPILSPLFRLIGADPAMFASIILANDMGGYQLATQLTTDAAIANFSGLLQGSMFGATIVFIIPVALSIIHKDDKQYLATGILVGLVSIPLGCLAGGLAMNLTPYKISFMTILHNIVPVIIIAIIICANLWFKPAKTISSFEKFGRFLTNAATALTVIAVFQYQTGIWFPLFDLMVDPAKNNGTVPLLDGLMICGQIAIIVIGAFPMVMWFTKTFSKPLQKIGDKLGMNEDGSAGLVACMANSIPMFSTLNKMNPKAKLLNVAFAVSASWVFGDHLAFTAANNRDMIIPVVIGKLTAGLTALILANIMAPKLLSRIEEIKSN